MGKYIECWAVPTIGGQIIGDCRPERAQIIADGIFAESFMRYGMTWDAYYNYYDTQEHAQNAINRELSN